MAISPLRNYFLGSTLNPMLGSERAVTRSVERLSSGLGINRASDDPAAFKLSRNLHNLSGYQSMAARNASDAISMVQIAEGALESVSSMLIKMRDLVTRGINGSFTSDQRKLLIQQISDLRDGINATADRTTMNDLRLLQGDFSIPVSGEFREALGEVTADQPTLQANSTVKTGVGSSLAVAGASRISVNFTDTETAPAGEYRFSATDNLVTLSRTQGTSNTSQSIRLTASAPNPGEVRIPSTAGDIFTLNFDSLGVTVGYRLEQLGTRNSPEDFAVLVANVGATRSATGWRAVPGANIAQGADEDQVVAIITSSGGNLRLGSSTGLTPLSGYGDAVTWAAGSTPSLGLVGTVSNVNAALQTLQLNATNGLGDIDISITPQFKNSVFFDSNVESVAGTRVSIPGWDIYRERFVLGSTAVNARVSSDDDNAMPARAPDYSLTSEINATYNYQFSADVPADVTGQSLRLFSQGMTTDSFGVVHGPYLVSQTPVTLSAGDTVSFNWKSQAGDDAFDSYAYLLETTTGAQVELLDVTGALNETTPWNTARVAVPTPGTYQFVFLAGTFDASGGRAAGGSLYLTNIQVNPSNPVDSTLKAFNIGEGGLISMDNAITLTAVQVNGIGPWKALDGIYRLVADPEHKTVTLKQYDVDIDTFSRAETINQISSFQVNETRTLEFPTLGVAITLTNTANEPLWLGVNKSGYEAETIVVQNRRINTDVTSPTFQVSDGSKFDIRISELRDIRIGSNGDASNAPIFNRLDRLINELLDSSAPEVDTLQTLRIAVDDTYKKVNEMSSELSGVINRLSATISSIETQIDLFSSSRSRVEETNYAKEIAEFVQMKAQRDISAATLAHLNVQPKVVLWLLQSDNPIKTTDMTKSKEPRRSHLEIEHVYA